MDPSDTARLCHMRDAAEKALAFVEGKERGDLDTDEQLVFALIRCTEIVGEAASKISTETRKRHHGIPWQQIINMRDRLIHTYFDVDLDIVWNTVIHDLVPLIAELERIVPRGPID